MREQVEISLGLSFSGEIHIHHHHHTDQSHPGAADILNSIRDLKETVMTRLDTSAAKETQDFQTLLTAVQALEAAFEQLKSDNNSVLQAALDAANLDADKQADILDANDDAVEQAIAGVNNLLNPPGNDTTGSGGGGTDTTGGTGGNDTVSGSGGGGDTATGGNGGDTTGGGSSGAQIFIGFTEFDTGVVGQPFNGNTQLNGGTPPYTVTSSPPNDNGLTVNSDGSISGTPTAAGRSVFNYSIQDSAQPANTASGTVTVVTAEPVQAA